MLDTKSRNYSGKIIKSKSLIFNCILILTIFAIIQVLGMIICFEFFSSSLLAILVIMFILNFGLYKILTL